MCLCNGTGGITVEKEWGAVIAPCPDTDCKFDRRAADEKYEAWKRAVVNYFESEEAV